MTPNEIAEIQVQKQLNDCVDSFESFRFNAGAGAGKTYALVETIRYIVKNKLLDLEKKNQQVVCITYTNVAVREIKERLGSSDIVLISTIHDRLWDVIRPYQQELVKLHLEKLQEDVKKTSEELLDETNTKFKKYAKLSDDQKTEFKFFAMKHREVYTANRDANAGEFKAAYEGVEDKPIFFSDLISNAQHFKEVVKRLYKLERYQRCITDIESKKKLKVEYDSGFNSDRLEFMKFSHDTLLEYACKLFEQYPMLQRVVIDKYPYFFIDEYQDTNEKVIQIVSNLYHAAKKYKKSWLVGYYGDTAQSIYDDGVGLHINAMHPEVMGIDKVFNRRSHKQIIDKINAIRNNEIVQEPIFDDRNQGDVAFYYSASAEDKKDISLGFIDRYRSDLHNDESVKRKDIHCLILTNKLVTELSQFGDIHRVISDSNIYYKDLNTKLLSNDLEKLHPSILLLYRIIKLHKVMLNDCSTYGDVLGKMKGRVSFADAHDLFERIRLLKSLNLGEFVVALSGEIEEEKCEQNLRLNFLSNLSVNLKEDDSAKNLKTYVLNKVKELMIASSSGASSDDEEKRKIDALLNIDLAQWHRWVDFIDRKDEGKDVIFHTYHGTKGEEYENVAIIMEHSIGGGWEGRDKLKNFFLKIGSLNKENTSAGEKEEVDSDFESIKNLLYVACSRAIKNLRILYIDDIGDIRSGIESIFGEILEWKALIK
ncbi:UvrD-helicase domain-containing protein [Aliikangiella sp. G2MR2-5]|uniref:UvrD-helicase domain-containing protein n=1 Tax=Aliikangiella sp. G2MR2-5 TaxID=2788943 RepID=UPI0018AC1F85|nr:UvrD-helicase domain-containing protein [Aliikangiella sp. G2MR2-5]